ncbi:hypothetical protein Scep_014650 [Stephania cephalantha]|uniref:Uncharacterized protein n=1 Tax=Stephania cephalantha TaxID=152367 RepID=A0AAP0J1M9_9MAGN
MYFTATGSPRYSCKEVDVGNVQGVAPLDDEVQHEIPIMGEIPKDFSVRPAPQPIFWVPPQPTPHFLCSERFDDNEREDILTNTHGSTIRHPSLKINIFLDPHVEYTDCVPALRSHHELDLVQSKRMERPLTPSNAGANDADDDDDNDA